MPKIIITTRIKKTMVIAFVFRSLPHIESFGACSNPLMIKATRAIEHIAITKLIETKFHSQENQDTIIPCVTEELRLMPLPTSLYK